MKTYKFLFILIIPLLFIASSASWWLSILRLKSFARAVNVDAALELPPPSPAPIGICLSKNTFTGSSILKWSSNDSFAFIIRLVFSVLSFSSLLLKEKRRWLGELNPAKAAHGTARCKCLK